MKAGNVKMKNKITVLGSINLDTTVRVDDLPKPGETIHSKEMFTNGGGKGANQAIAAARNGADVNFIGMVGNDASGEVLLDLLEQDEISIEGIKKLETARTGTAFVTVSDDGENSIIIYGGANQLISDEHIHGVSHLIDESDFLIAQFETNLSSIETAFELANQAGVTTILNPAPALREIPSSIIDLTDIFVPNETELATIVGHPVEGKEGLAKAAKEVHELGVKILIVTLGSQGVYYSIAGGETGFVPALKVKAIDTTAAGDTFIGSFTTKLNSDLSNIKEAITYANKASSITVQRYGAQPSIPYQKEVEE